MSGRPRCKCGVYESAHREGRGCGNYRKASRLRLWFHDHALAHHFVGEVWAALPEKVRWKAAGWYHERRPDLCWCDMVGAAMPGRKGQSWECGCDVPLLTDATVPVPGGCYCTPPEGWSAA